MAESLFYFFLLGGAMFLIYDLFRLLRLLFVRVWIAFFLDFFWWVAFAFSFFSFLLVFSNGAIRSVYLIACILGFLALYFTLGTLTKQLWLKIGAGLRRKLKVFCAKVKKVLQLPWKLLYNKIDNFKKKRRLKKSSDENASKSEQGGHKRNKKRRVLRYEKRDKRANQEQQTF